MDYLFHIFAFTVVGIATLACIAIWSPRAGWIRIAALALAVLMMPLGIPRLCRPALETEATRTGLV